MAEKNQDIALVALRAFPYARQQIAVGQAFSAPPKDARALIAHARARLAAEKPAKAGARKGYKRRDVVAEPAVEPQS